MRNEKLRSVDGKELTIYVWDEVESPKAVLQLSHGMCENLGRYDDFARFMNKHGYIVIGDDHRGYGLTERRQRLVGGRIRRLDRYRFADSERPNQTEISGFTGGLFGTQLRQHSGATLH